MRGDDELYAATFDRGRSYGYASAAEPDPLAEFVRRWWWLLAIGVILGASAGAAYAWYGPATYQTSVLIQVPAQQTQFDPTVKADQARSAAINYAAEASSPRTSELASAALAGQLDISATELIRMKRSGEIKISAVDDANFIQITVTNSDPDRALLLANTYGTVVVDDVNARTAAQADEQRGRLEEQISFIRERMATSELFLREQQLEQEIRDQRMILLGLQSGFQQEVERQAEYDRLDGTPGFDEPASEVEITRATLLAIMDDQIQEVAENLGMLEDELNEVQGAIAAIPASTDASTAGAFTSAYSLELGGLTSQYVSQQVAALTATPPLARYGEATTPIAVQNQRKMLLFGIVLGGAAAAGIGFLIDRWQSRRRSKTGSDTGAADLDRLDQMLERFERIRLTESGNGAVSTTHGAHRNASTPE